MKATEADHHDDAGGPGLRRATLPLLGRGSSRPLVVDPNTSRSYHSPARPGPPVKIVLQHIARRDRVLLAARALTRPGQFGREPFVPHDDRHRVSRLPEALGEGDHRCPSARSSLLQAGAAAPPPSRPHRAPRPGPRPLEAACSRSRSRITGSGVQVTPNGSEMATPVRLAPTSIPSTRTYSLRPATTVSRAQTMASCKLCADRLRRRGPDGLYLRLPRRRPEKRSSRPAQRRRP